MTNPEFLELIRTRAESRENVDGRYSAQHLLTLYNAALRKPNGCFLELGTQSGISTRVLLAACEVNGARLVSVDIADCSLSATSDRWTFVKSDSTQRQKIIAQAPDLQNGIDLIYVDSLHTAQHVSDEIYTWFDLVKQDGAIYFDDVESAPYMTGFPSDNAMIEIENRGIRTLLEDVLYSNYGEVNLVVHYGSTGLASLHKTSGFGTKLAPVYRIKRRWSRLGAQINARIIAPSTIPSTLFRLAMRAKTEFFGKNV